MRAVAPAAGSPRPAAPSPRRAWARVARLLGPRRRRGRWAWATALFLLAFAVRSLYAVDLALALEGQVQPGSRMMQRYDEGAAALLRGDSLVFVSGVDPSDTSLLARPPGYSILLAGVYLAVGRGLFAAQLVQNALNALVPALVFVLADRLLTRRVAVASGLIAALLPHLAYFSALLTPDVVCVVPVLAALALLAPAARGRRIGSWTALAAGGLFGMAVWLRPNLLLMGPAVGAVLALTAVPRARPWKTAVAVVAGSALAVAPITVRNYVVYGALVPVSTNLGIVLWEGLGEASGNAWGTVTDDVDVAAQEARMYGDPRYGEWWASPDGIRRDRDRVRRSLRVISEHPAWFASVAFRRALQMMDYAGADAPPVAPRGAVPAERLDALHEPGRGRPATHLWGADRLTRLRPRVTSRDAVAVGRALGAGRAPLAAAQAVLTALALPLVLLGLGAALALAPRRALFLLAVPAYQVAFQSIVHFEFRYVVPMHACLVVFAGVAVALVVGLRDAAARRRRARRLTMVG